MGSGLMASAWGASFGKAWGNAWGRIADAAQLVGTGGGAYHPRNRYGLNHPFLRPVFDYEVPERTVRAIVKATESVIDQRKARDVEAEKRLIEERLSLADLAESREYIAALRLLIAFECQRYEQELEEAAIVMLLFEM